MKLESREGDVNVGALVTKNLIDYEGLLRAGRVGMHLVVVGANRRMSE